MRRLAIILVLALATACGSKLVGQCDTTQTCDGGLTCVSGGVCAQGCNALGDGGDCPAGMSCRATGIFCEPDQACPALALDACLFPDGGT